MTCARRSETPCHRSGPERQRLTTLALRETLRNRHRPALADGLPCPPIVPEPEQTPARTPRRSPGRRAMKMPDVNVLVYADRRDEPVHEFYRDWLDSLGTRGCLSDCRRWSAWLRSHRYEPALPRRSDALSVALGTVDRLCEAPGCRWLLPEFATGKSPPRSAGRRAPRASRSRMPDTRHWPSSTAVSGSREMMTSHGFAPYGLDWEPLLPGAGRPAGEGARDGHRASKRHLQPGPAARLLVPQRLDGIEVGRLDGG